MENDSFFRRLTTIIWNEKRRIERIINPQIILFAEIDTHKLINKNLNDLEKILEQENNDILKIIVQNIKQTDSSKRNFFKFPISVNGKEDVDAICMSERHTNGYLYLNIICTDQSNTKNEEQTFKNYILETGSFGPAIGLLITHINDQREKDYLIFNDTIKKMYGSDDVRLSKNWDELEENKTDLLAIKKHSFTFDKRLYFEDGTLQRWLIITKRIFKCENNDYFIVSTITDATSLSQKYSNKGELDYYYSLYKNIPESVAIYDINGVLKFTNSKYLELFYVDKCEIINHRTIKSDKSIPHWALDKINSGETVSYNNVYEIEKSHTTDTLKQDKEIRLLSIKIMPIRNMEDDIIGCVQIFDDFTETNIDKHLLDVIYKNIPIGIILYDKDGNLLNLNDRNREIMGIPFSVNLEEVNLFKEPNLSKKYIRMLKSGQDVVFDLDYNFNVLEGYFETSYSHIKKLRISILVIRNHGIVDGYLLMNQDMTLIKSKESLLKEKNEKLGMALENSDLIIWEYHCDKKKFTIDRKHIQKAEFLNSNLDYYKDYISEDTYNSYIKIYDVLTNRKKETFIEDLCLSSSKENKIVYLTFFGKPYQYNEQGEIISYIGYRKDITSNVKLIKSLQDSISKNKLILDNIGTGVAYINKDYHIIWKNNFFNEFHNVNISDKKLLGNKCFCSIYNRTEPCENCIIEKVLKSGETESIANYKNAHDVFNLIGVPVRDGGDCVIGVVLRIEKITNEYKAKKELESLSQMLQNIIDNLPLGLYIKDIDDDFKYLIVNKTVCKVSNFKPEECIGKTDYDILDKKYADEFREDDRDIVKLYAETNLPVIKYKRVLFKNSEKYLKTINIVFKQDNKNILISIAHNETEREKLIKELSIAKEQAEESDKLKSAFLANMSHEIRTPLNAIVGFSEVLATNDNKEENDEYIKIIRSNNQILLRLINDILDLSKLDAGVIKLQNREFDLAELENNFMAFYDNNKINSEVEFIMDLPYSKCIVTLDEQRFLQIFNNFVTNAIKYTNRGYIKFGYKYEDNGIKIYVKDTGLGIPKSVQNKIFTRFGKLNEDVPGNGLGLTICKAIMDMQNGKIGFESEENKGSTFWAWFPTCALLELKNTNSTNSQVFKKADNIDLPIDCAKSQGQKKPIKILVAEDNDSNYLLLKTILKNYYLTRVVNGLEAVEKVQKESFDIILMDMKMPVMGGLEATKQIRKMNKDIVIVALTASVFSSEMKAEREAGCNEIITKPITVQGRKCLFDILDSLEIHL